MKRYVIPGVAIAVLLFFFLAWRGHRENEPSRPDSASEALATTNPPRDTQSVTNEPMERAKSVPAVTNPMGYEDPETIRAFNDSPDVPISFYGLVVDQDSNALQNVKVDLRISQWQPTTPLGENIKNIQVQPETGADGRFDLSGVNGHIVKVIGLSKDGYEPEVMQREYGEYGPHGGSPEKREVFRMWSTNLDQSLITGNHSFAVTPDGRHYAIDLAKGTISEGDHGDLVAWIKRPEKIGWRERYEWACELAIPTGSLCETGDSAMFRAPEAGYSNRFAFHQEADINRWGDGTGDKHFYLRLHDGQMYGRITINLFAFYNGTTPGMIRLSYAVNPSGSRILRAPVYVPSERDWKPTKLLEQLKWPPR